MSAGAGGLHTASRGRGDRRGRSRRFGLVVRRPRRVGCSGRGLVDSAGSGATGAGRGTTTPSSLRASQQFVVDAPVGRAHRGDLGPDLLDRFETEIGAEEQRQLGGDHPVGPGGARRRDSWSSVLTRPSRFVVVPVTSANPAAGSTTSACCDDSVRNCRSAITVRAPASARAGQVAVGEVGERVGAEQHQHVDAAVGRRLQDAGGVEPGVGRHGGPAAAANHSRPASSVTRPGSKPGASPMSRAPCTLARRSAGRKRTLGMRGEQRARRRRRRRRPTRRATARRARR